MIAAVGIRYRNYTHYTLYRSCLPILGSLLLDRYYLLFLDDFEGNASISGAIESGSIVFLYPTATILSTWPISFIDRFLYSDTMYSLL